MPESSPSRPGGFDGASAVGRRVSADSDARWVPIRAVGDLSHVALATSKVTAPGRAAFRCGLRRFSSLRLRLPASSCTAMSGNRPLLWTCGCVRPPTHVAALSSDNLLWSSSRCLSAALRRAIHVDIADSPGRRGVRPSGPWLSALVAHVLGQRERFARCGLTRTARSGTISGTPACPECTQARFAFAARRRGRHDGVRALQLRLEL
jgi:hypothetical protein